MKYINEIILLTGIISLLFYRFIGLLILIMFITKFLLTPITQTLYIHPARTSSYHTRYKTPKCTDHAKITSNSVMQIQNNVLFQNSKLPKSSIATRFNDIQNLQPKNSNIAFALLVTFISYAMKANHGEYAGNNNFALLNNIARKKFVMHKITIPEGLSSYQIAELLFDEPKLSGFIIVAPEGSLLPGTYLYTRNTKRMTIIKKMKTDLSNLITELWHMNNAQHSSKLHWITLASIVQKESMHDEDMPIISSILMNRLNQNIKLDCDTTVVYGITQGKYHISPVMKKDIAIHSKYNTYKSRGLPQSPICNPGKNALQSALNPMKTQMLFFHHRKGNMITSKDLNTHINSYKQQ